jgi:nucleoside 2-deoxyribosyltransferase
MKIYLAAPFGQRGQVREYAAQLEAAGHEITQRWFDGEPISGNGTNPEFSAEALKCAKADLAGIRACNYFVSINGFSGTGGKHTELGVALALSKRIAIVGVPENVFYWIVTERYATWEEFFKQLCARSEECFEENL